MKEEAVIITAFDSLDEAVQFQLVQPDTMMTELNLPAKLNAWGYTLTGSSELTPESENIVVKGIKWEPDTSFEEPSVQGSYLFTPVLPDGYTLAENVKLPQITVEVDGWTFRSGRANNNYDLDDIAAFQGILEAHPSLKDVSDVEKGNPASWENAGVVVWSGTPKRIIELDLSNLLTDALTGELDVSGLTELETLYIDGNELTSLNLQGLSRLETISANDNLLQGTLDLTELTALGRISCSKNQLTGLNVSGLTELGFLFCQSNRLTELDISGLSLMKLICNKNPLESFRTTDGTLTIKCEAGGMVSVTYEPLFNKVTLMATLDGDYNFEQWTELPDGCNDNGQDTVSFTLNNDEIVQAAFIHKNDADKNNYHDGDETAFRNMLDAHPVLKNISGIDEGDPASWQMAGLAEWDITTAPYRLTGLSLADKNLTYMLDVSELTALTRLDCSQNRLQKLDVSGLSALTSLESSDNPLTEFTAQNNKKLTVREEAGGTAFITDCVPPSSVTVEATADNSYVFQKWKYLNGMAMENPLVLNLDQDTEITASFIIPAIPVTGVKLNQSSLTLMVGESTTLTATVEPADATDKTVIWESSDTRVATVDENGKVIAQAVGIVNITANTNDGNKIATCILKVIKSQFPFDNESREDSSSSSNNRFYDAKKGWISLLSGIITGSGSGYSRWLQDENGWKLRYANGTIAAGSSMTAGDGKVYELLVWEFINGVWYAFGEDGYAKSGMIFDPILGGYFYIDINTGMKTGWQLLNGTWNFFNPISDGKKGILLTDSWIDGWYVDKNGAWNGEAKID